MRLADDRKIVVGKAYYAAKDPSRPIYFPKRIPAKLEEMVAATEQMLGDLGANLKAHQDKTSKLLCTQVIRGFWLLERLPTMAVTSLACHDLKQASQERKNSSVSFAQEHAQAMALMNVIQAQLQPGLVHPARKAELEELKSREVQRAHQSLATTEAFAKHVLAELSRQGPAVVQRILLAARALLQLLDSCLMPADLPPELLAATDGLERKDLVQLHQLAVALDQAAVTSPDVLTADSKGAAGPKKAAPGAKPGKAPGPGAKPGSPATKKPSGKDDSFAPAAPRSFDQGGWQVTLGDFRPEALGWTHEDETAAGTTALASDSVAEQDLSSTAVLCGLDTPLHRAVIRAVRAGIKQVEEGLTQSMTVHRSTIKLWVQEEQKWAVTWANLLSNLDNM